MEHKHKVAGLKHQFLSQKVKEKKILSDQICLQRIAIAKVQKETRQLAIEN
jgi:hypothetical protein